MDYITDNLIYDETPYSVSLKFYKLYSDVFYKTHIYIVNNLYTNHEIYNNYDDNELTSLQYFNVMSFLDEFK